jgi:hypothetical protein
MHILNKKRWIILGKLIIDGKSVYEVDEECLKKRKVPEGCKVEEALKRQREKEMRIKK